MALWGQPQPGPQHGLLIFPFKSPVPPFSTVYGPLSLVFSSSFPSPHRIFTHHGDTHSRYLGVLFQASPTLFFKLSNVIYLRDSL